MKINKDIPVNVITGFLGAGKTTFIINLLKQKEKSEQWAVLINEFGKVSIDFETLAPKATANEKIFEISGGCICCSAKDNFQQNLEEIIAQHKYDRIIIEPSGLGGAEMISEIIKENKQLNLLPVIALVSIDYLELEKLKINPIFRNQLLQADILILSKCDLETDQSKHNNALKKLKKEYPGKLLYAKSFDGSSDKKLLNFKKQDEEIKNTFEKLMFSGTELEDRNYNSVSLVFEKDNTFNLNQVLQILANEESVIRAKGFLHGTEGWHSINYTPGTSKIENCSARQESTLVVIAENANTHLFDELRRKIE